MGNASGVYAQVGQPVELQIGTYFRQDTDLGLKCIYFVHSGGQETAVHTNIGADIHSSSETCQPITEKTKNVVVVFPLIV